MPTERGPPLTLYGFENLIDNFGVQGFARVERNDDSLFLLHVNAMAAFASLQPEARPQQHVFGVRRREAG